MKAVVFLVLISIFSVALAQPTLDGTWVSDSCEPIPGRNSKFVNNYFDALRGNNNLSDVAQGFNFWYVRTYTIDGDIIQLETKIYQTSCAANNYQAQVISQGVCKPNPRCRSTSTEN